MIVFDLQCLDGGETFEAWFRSGSEYEQQQAGGLVLCPVCRSGNVAKAPMAPRLPRNGSGDSLARLATMQAELLKDSRWVGDAFADTARAMHSGDAEPALVHGNATVEQAIALAQDGIPVVPLPLPVVPPNQMN